VAEAMAVGTPVICSDAPAMVEVAGDAAVVVPREDAVALAEAIAALLADPAERARRSAAGRTRAAMFDWDRVAERAWAVYRGVR
jgi:glycosyltransferase involved in cell wall biosynthesis